MAVKTTNYIEKFTEYLKGITENPQVILPIIGVIILVVAYQYLMKHFPKHREMKINKNLTDIKNIKTLSDIDWSSINEINALYIESVLYEKFKNFINIDDFLVLSRYGNTLEAISTYVKFKYYMTIDLQNKKIVKNEKSFEVKLKLIYRRNLELLIVAGITTFLAVLFFIVSQVTFAFFQASQSIPSLIFAIMTFIISMICIVLTIYVGNIFGEPTVALRHFKRIFDENNYKEFPLTFELKQKVGFCK